MANRNTSIFVCLDYERINSDGFWYGNNPLDFTTPLLILQIIVITFTSNLINICLKPLRQSVIVSQILGGLVLGPSLLGQIDSFSETFFPLRGKLILETLGAFAIMFVFFLIGVKSDVTMMLQPDKKAMTLGFSVFIFTISIPTTLAIILVKTNIVEPSQTLSLPLATMSQSITTLPVIACLLMELKIINTKLGRLALATTIFCDILGVSVISITFSISDHKNSSLLNVFSSIGTAAALIGIASFMFRPLVLWIVDQTPSGKSVQGGHICMIFLVVLGSGLLSELIGQHYVFGPMIFGLAVPDGPPLGSAIVAKLDSLISEFLYPVFLACSGLKTNIRTIHFKTFVSMTLLLTFESVVKIGAIVFPALYFNEPLQEAIVLGILMNAKGVTELVLYNLWKDIKILGDEEFSMLVISVIVATSMVPNLVGLIYNPTEVCTRIERNILCHPKDDSEFRLMVCTNQDNIPTIMNLLEVSNPTIKSPIMVIAMELVELVGRSMPTLIAHGEQPLTTRKLEPNSSKSSHIVNALRHYKRLHDDCCKLSFFTSVSHLDAMHNDILQVIEEHHVTVVIMPFHKQWAIDGSIGVVSRQTQALNINVLAKAPCSVGILVDRGILKGSLSVINARTCYHVLVFFFGGDDDMESLTYGSRMTGHERVVFTLVRFLLPEVGAGYKTWKVESDYINMMRIENASNERFVYVEEEIVDGVGLACALKKILTDDTNFDLIIVGKRHPESEMMCSLQSWSECHELGVVGDMLASMDFRSTSSILVVQQHKVTDDMSENVRRVEDGHLLQKTPSSVMEE